jgi:hypothetical protein
MGGGRYRLPHVLCTELNRQLHSPLAVLLSDHRNQFDWKLAGHHGRFEHNG